MSFSLDNIIRHNKQLTIFFLALIAVGILLVSGFIPSLTPATTEEDYGTGLNINTSTEINGIKKSSGEPFPRGTFTRDAGKEIFVNDKNIVSWIPGEHSQLITMQCQFDYRCLWQDWFGGGQEAVSFSRYYVTVDYIDPHGEKTRIIDTHNGVDVGNADMWNTDYVEMVTSRFPDSERYYSKGGGGHLFPNIAYSSPSGLFGGDLVGGNPINKWYDVQGEIQQGASYLKNWHELETDTFEFYMKGLRTGALEANFYLEYCDHNYDDNLGSLLTEWKYRGYRHLGKDSCYLASGAGGINILSTGHIPRTEVTEQSDLETDDGAELGGDYYTKFTFEEETAVKISVDTGYSGTSLNPNEEGYGEGWTLSIYNSQGMQVKEYRNIPDNLRGRILTYQIPSGSFVPNDPGDNVWRVVLKNTLFDQAETRLFVVDSYEKVPGKPTVEFDKEDYQEGDTVHVTLTANANNVGTDDIDHFYVIAKYGDSSSMYNVEGFPKTYPAIHQGSGEYTATISFELQTERPVTLEHMYVRANAIDSEGRASGEFDKSIYIEQKPDQATPGDVLSQMSDDGGLLILLVVAIIIIVIITYLVILYKKGKLNFPGGNKK